MIHLRASIIALLALVAVAVVVGRGDPAYAWTAPVPLNTDAISDSRDDGEPQVTTDGGGNWVAVWYAKNIGGDHDILVARSADNGANWTPPVPLNANAATDSGNDLYPDVETDNGGNWVAVWYSYDSLGGTIGTDVDVLVARSSDNGANWTPPAPLNGNAATDTGLDATPQVTTDGSGNWVAVWNSGEANVGGGIGTDRDILVARSTDNGATWTPPASLNTNAATDSNDDNWPQVTTDGGGNWVAVWHSTDSLGATIGTDRDILVARSIDNGATWTPPVPLNNNASTDSGVDYWPQVTTDGGGNWVSVWSSDDSLAGTIGTEEDIFVAHSTDNGATWTDPAALNNNAATDPGVDYWPQVTSDGGGNWVSVWGSNDSLVGTIGTDFDILVAHSTDNGATWTDPAALTDSASTDSGNDVAPQVTTDGGGKWVAVWRSNEANVGSGIGTDTDVLYSTDVLVAVGGIAAFPDVEEPVAGAGGPSGGSSFPYAAVAGGLAAAALALAGSGWYARRRPDGP